MSIRDYMRVCYIIHVLTFYMTIIQQTPTQLMDYE